MGDGGRWGVQVQYAFDGPRLLGTGGALRAAADRAGRRPSSSCTATRTSAATFARSRRAFLESGQPGLMTVFRNDGRFDRSNVLFDDGRILATISGGSSPEMQHVDYGLGGLRRRR